jgi:hypothetical protein
MSDTGWRAGEYSSAPSDQSLRRLAATGAEWIALIVQGYQETVASTITSWEPPRTPSDDDLKHAIATAHAMGLRVMLKPHVDLARDPSHWRGDIGTAFPDDSALEAWFASYSEAMLRFAALAQAQRVEQFCVGTELVGLSDHDQFWRDLIQKVRERFRSPIVYASNHGEEALVRWWDALDFIGVDAYYALSDSATPTVTELKRAWVDREHVSLLRSLNTKFGKPVLFTEIGYRSVDFAAQAPWSYATTPPANPQAQANAYQAALETFADEPWFAGFYWWNWPTNPNQGGPGDTDYIPVGKPAEQVLTHFYQDTQRE